MGLGGGLDQLLGLADFSKHLRHTGPDGLGEGTELFLKRALLTLPLRQRVLDLAVLGVQLLDFPALVGEVFGDLDQLDSLAVQLGLRALELGGRSRYRVYLFSLAPHPALL